MDGLKVRLSVYPCGEKATASPHPLAAFLYVTDAPPGISSVYMDGTVTVQCPAVGQGMIKDMQLAHNYEVRAKGHGFAILLDGAEAKGVEDLAPDVSCVVRAPDVSCVVRASMFV